MINSLHFWNKHFELNYKHYLRVFFVGFSKHNFQAFVLELLVVVLAGNDLFGLTLLFLKIEFWSK